MTIYCYDDIVVVILYLYEMAQMSIVKRRYWAVVLLQGCEPSLFVVEWMV